MAAHGRSARDIETINKLKRLTFLSKHEAVTGSPPAIDVKKLAAVSSIVGIAISGSAPDGQTESGKEQRGRYVAYCQHPFERSEVTVLAMGCAVQKQAINQRGNVGSSWGHAGPAWPPT